MPPSRALGRSANSFFSFILLLLSGLLGTL
jgi:hypothetical protein